MIYKWTPGLPMYSGCNSRSGWSNSGLGEGPIPRLGFGGRFSDSPGPGVDWIYDCSIYLSIRRADADGLLIRAQTSNSTRAATAISNRDREEEGGNYTSVAVA